MLELVVLTVRDCPNEQILAARLTEALDGLAEVSVTRRVVETEADAVRFGMHGSPTLLINGVDVFAAPDALASVSCRLYPGEAGGPTGGAPSVAALRAALGEAAAGPWAAVLAQAAGRSGLGRVAPVDGGLRAVHQCVLRAFAVTGRPPREADVDDAAARYESAGAQVLARLHTEDFLRLDGAGAVSAAYPFSASPTPHRVRISGGPEVFSMCAIDALGIAAMVGRDVVVRSVEPGTGKTITVAVPSDGAPPVWEPASAVVFYGQERQADVEDCCTAPATVPPRAAADVCCGYINVFSTADTARAWVQDHPDVSGQILTQRQAWEIGVRIFGPLLNA